MGLITDIRAALNCGREEAKNEIRIIVRNYLELNEDIEDQLIDMGVDPDNAIDACAFFPAVEREMRAEAIELIKGLVDCHQRDYPDQPIDPEWLTTAYCECFRRYQQIITSGEFDELAHQTWTIKRWKDHD